MANSYRCPLGAMQPKEMDREKIKSRAWNEDGWLVVHRDDPDLHWIERETILSIGERKFGNLAKGKK